MLRSQTGTSRPLRSEPGVLHIVPTLLGDRGELLGGAERYVFELARHMAREVPTTLLSFGENEVRDTAGGLRLRIETGAWHARGQAGNPLHPAILSELRRADVVHCHQTHVLASSLTAVAGRLLRRPVFTTDLGGGGWDLSAYFSTDGWFNGHLHISEYSREVSGHADRDDARVVLGGVDAEKFSPGPTEPGPGGYALFVGRLLPHKGIDDLISGLPDDLPLEVVGRVHEPEYLAVLKQLATGKQVRFHHDVRDDQLINLYRNALCIVLPSVYRSKFGWETPVPELLGQTLLEGMACGRPAICTDVASMPEIVEDGVNGFVVPPNDPAALGSKLAIFRDQPEMVSEFGRKARERMVELFSWEAVTERCLRAYGELAT